MCVIVYVYYNFVYVMSNIFNLCYLVFDFLWHEKYEFAKPSVLKESP